MDLSQGDTSAASQTSKRCCFFQAQQGVLTKTHGMQGTHGGYVPCPILSHLFLRIDPEGFEEF